MRLQTEYLYQRAVAVGSLAETQTRVDDPRVVIHKHRVLGQQAGQVGKQSRLPPSLAVSHQQQTLVALLERMFGYSLVGQRIVVILDADFLYITLGHTAARSMSSLIALQGSGALNT